MLEQKSNSIEERVGTYLRRVYGLVVKGSSLEPEGSGLIPETTNFLTNSSRHGQATYACVSLFTKQYKIDTSYLYGWLGLKQSLMPCSLTQKIIRVHFMSIEAKCNPETYLEKNLISRRP